MKFLLCNLAALVFGLAGCLNGLTVIDGYECDKFADDKLYFGRALSERTAEIRTYPLEKQYAASDDQALMKLLEQGESRMRDPEKKQEFTQRFEHIRGR